MMAKIALAVVILFASGPGLASAQTRDEFFADGRLQEVRLVVS